MNRVIENVDNAELLHNFHCGIPSMDDFIHKKKNGLNDFVIHGLTSLWIIREGDQVIGFFALSKSALILNSIDVREMEENGSEKDFFELRESFPAIKIDYLAVSDHHRSNRLGSEILSIIREGTIRDKFSASMFIIVEALDTPEYSAVEFYRKNYFRESEYGLVKKQSKRIYGERVDTSLMYLPLF